MKYSRLTFRSLGIPIATMLKNISIRRNQIVHEGDYSNALLQRQAITHTDTSDVVDFIFSLGTTIYNLVK